MFNWFEGADGSTLRSFNCSINMLDMIQRGLIEFCDHNSRDGRLIGVDWGWLIVFCIVGGKGVSINLV